jgi:hypothetical protein
MAPREGAKQNRRRRVKADGERSFYRISNRGLSDFLVFHVRLVFLVEVDWFHAVARDQTELEPIVMFIAEVHFVRLLFAAL